MKNKTLYYVVGGVLTAITGYFVFDLVKGNQTRQNLKSAQKQKVGENSLAPNELSSTGRKEGKDSYPLKVGSTGANVWVLQEALNKLGQGITVDGVFGQETYNAVQNVPNGFGLLNFTCGIGYACKVTYDNWNDIIAKARLKGFEENASWTRAKRKWIV